MERKFLKHLDVGQARFLALLAKVAREQRDALLGDFDERVLEEFVPAHGERNPAATLAFEPLPPDDLQRKSLQEAVGELSEAARREVYALMLIGQGQLAPNQWHRGLADAEALGDEAVTTAILEDVDLHDHIAKGLYEIKLAA